jgi:hypothetical protein
MPASELRVIDLKPRLFKMILFAALHAAAALLVYHQCLTKQVLQAAH